MARLLATRLHDGGNVAMRMAAPEKEIVFNGFGELLCLNIGENGWEDADAELIRPDAMPEKRHTLKQTPMLEIAYAADWSRILIEAQI